MGGRVKRTSSPSVGRRGRTDRIAHAKRVEEELRQSEQLLRLAMEASSAGAWSWNARTNESNWDDRYHEMYGFAADEPRTYEGWLGRIHPDDRPRVVARLESMRQTPDDDGWNMEFRAVSPKRGVLWMHGLGRARRDEHGQISSMTGINLDITARKHSEGQLRESEEQLRLFFENVPSAVAMLDRNMCYLAASRRWLQDFGLSGDLTGRSHYDVFPEIPERWKAIHRRCMAGAVERSDDDSFERADGSVQWLRWEIHPWRTAIGEIGGLIMLSEDVTETRLWRERQQVLLDEMQHRTRNLITVVEAIAQQTMRATSSMDAFMAQFSIRLSALSRVQGLLSRSERTPITIGALISLELEALGPHPGVPRAIVEGPDVRLRKRSVQTLALAIHELATNARKYGALATESGRLSVTWRIERAADGAACLALEWAETGIEQRLDRADPQRFGYGRTLIEKALPYSLSAKTTFEVGDREFRCTITLPLERLDGGEAGG